MSKSDAKVTVILSHQQDLEGKTQKAGTKIDIEPRIARALVSRGSAQLQDPKADAQVIGKTAAKVAEKEGK